MFKFKEKISTTYILSIIISISIVTIPFLIIVFANSANLKFLPVVLVWCAICILVAFYRFQLITNIKLSDKVMFVPNRGYHRSINDVRGQIKILNGRLIIPYNEITEIKIQNRTIYLSYNGISNSVVLHPIDIEQFVLALKENIINLGLNIPIHSEFPKESLLEFKNDILTNKPTLICFFIILSFPNFAGFFNGDFIFASATLLTTIVFFISIFEFRTTIILSDDYIIQTNQLGDIDLATQKIAYKDIKKITKTKWKVAIKTKQNDTIYFVSDPKKLNIFNSKLQNKLSKFKNNF